jgi:hypothetical protein
LQSLKGKFTKESIIDLYNRTTTDSVAKILFHLILDTCPKAPPQLTPVKTSVTTNLDLDDPYGAYGDNIPVQAEEASRSLVDIIVTAYS